MPLLQSLGRNTAFNSSRVPDRFRADSRDREFYYSPWHGGVCGLHSTPNPSCAACRRAVASNPHAEAQAQQAQQQTQQAQRRNSFRRSGRERGLFRLFGKRNTTVYIVQDSAQQAQGQGIIQDRQESVNYFGTEQHEDPQREHDPAGGGAELLYKLIASTLGAKAEQHARKRMAYKAVKTESSFSYQIHQGTEESDLDIVSRDLQDGRLYPFGLKLEGGSWCNLLFGDIYTANGSKRQRHELTYTRSSCTCIACIVRDAREYRRLNGGSDEGSMYSGGVAESVSSRLSQVPPDSAKANFVVQYQLPPSSVLAEIGALAARHDLPLGKIVRLGNSKGATFKFTPEIKQILGHIAYTGPIRHEELFRDITTIGVNFYKYNKGKKERNVYIRGHHIQLPIKLGVVKLGLQPMYMPDLGATYVLYRSQIMSVYVGEIVLEGNSIGSYIDTGKRYYVGFGEDRGACAVFPNKKLGEQRRLGINELLLHHHMVDDLSVSVL